MTKRRTFLKNTSLLGLTPLIPNFNLLNINAKVKTAHVGVGGMGKSDLNDIASHKNVEVFALCDVDNKALIEAGKLFPNAKLFKDTVKC